MRISDWSSDVCSSDLTTTLPTFGWAVGWLFGYAAVGTAARTIGSRQRAFAQSALGKYLPADVAAQILRDPDQLSLHGERRNIFCVFTDLEGFTKLSHAEIGRASRRGRVGESG